jgi:hypothetical protein
MARWRQAVELGMTDEEIATLAAIARLRARRRVGWSGRKCYLRSLRWGKDLASLTRRSNVAWSGQWPMAPWQHSMTDRDGQ